VCEFIGIDEIQVSGREDVEMKFGIWYE